MQVKIGSKRSDGRRRVRTGNRSGNGVMWMCNGGSVCVCVQEQVNVWFIWRMVERRIPVCNRKETEYCIRNVKMEVFRKRLRVPELIHPHMKRSVRPTIGNNKKKVVPRTRILPISLRNFASSWTACCSSCTADAAASSDPHAAPLDAPDNSSRHSK